VCCVFRRRTWLLCGVVCSEEEGRGGCVVFISSCVHQKDVVGCVVVCSKHLDDDDSNHNGNDHDQVHQNHTPVVFFFITFVLT
jgi:hypothetical protein